MNHNEQAAEEREYYYQSLEIRANEREDIRDALGESREELARLLAKLSAERNSPDGERLWESIEFENWWQAVITKHHRDDYRAAADQVIEFMKGRI